MELSQVTYSAKKRQAAGRVAVYALGDERANTWLVAAMIIAALAAIAIWMGKFSTFYSVDGGIKYLAALNISQHLQNPSIPYPLHRVDPTGRYTLPLTAWVNGHDYAGYSLPFLYLAGLSMAVFGKMGVIVPALLGTAALLAAQVQLAKLLGFRNPVPVLVTTVAATPIIFYSLTLWEHTWGVAPFLLATALLLRTAGTWPSAGVVLKENRRPGHATAGFVLSGLASGGLLAGAVLARREMVVAACVLLLLVPAVYRSRSALIPCSIALVAMCLPVFIILAAHPEPLVIGLTHASPGRAAVGVGPPISRLSREGWLTSGPASILFAGWTVYLIWLRVKQRPHFARMFTIGALVTGLVFTLQLLAVSSQADLNPMLFSPIVIWGLWAPLLMRGDAWRHPGPRICLWLLAVVGAFATVWFAYDSGGSQWGPRYLLMVFPILMLLALTARNDLLSEFCRPHQRRAAMLSFGGLLIVSVLLQGIGVMSIETAKRKWSATAAQVARLPGRVVVSTGDSSIDMLVTLVPAKELLWAQTGSDLRKLVALLGREGVNRIDFVCAIAVHCPWRGLPGWSHNHVRQSSYVRYSVYSRL